MTMIGLRAMAIALIGFGVSAPAFANGLMEDARQLFRGDLTSDYNKAVNFLGSYNVDKDTDEAKDLLEDLNDSLEKLEDHSSDIADAAKELAPDLRDVWELSAREIRELVKAAELLGKQVERKEQFRLDDLKARFNSTGYALEKSYSNMEGFGKRLETLISRIEISQRLYSGEVTDAYDRTNRLVPEIKKILEDSAASEEAKDAAFEKAIEQVADFRELAETLYESTDRYKDVMRSLSEDLARELVNERRGPQQLNIAVGGLEMELKSGYRLNWKQVEEVFKLAGEHLRETSKDTLDYAKKFKKMCECR